MNDHTLNTPLNESEEGSCVKRVNTKHKHYGDSYEGKTPRRAIYTVHQKRLATVLCEQRLTRISILMLLAKCHLNYH